MKIRLANIAKFTIGLPFLIMLSFVGFIFLFIDIVFLNRIDNGTLEKIKDFWRFVK